MVRRFAVVLVLAASTVMGGAAPAFAHGAGRADLPLPVSVFAAGASLVLVVAFAALSSRWTAPRLQQVVRGRSLESTRGVRVLLRSLRGIGLVAFGLVAAARLFDGSGGVHNVAPPLVWVLFWLGVPFASAVLGDVWRLASPFRTLARWANRHRPERPDLAARLGSWPATGMLLVFWWLALVYRDPADPLVVAVAALAYVAWMLALTAWAGVETGHEIGGAFHHSNGLLARIAPIGYGRPEGVGTATAAPHTLVDLHYRGWLRTLPQAPIRRGLAAFVTTMIGTVAYDGLAATDWWGDVWRRTARTEWFGTIALLGTVAFVYGAFLLAAWAASRLVHSTLTPSEVAASFAHALVPMALAYLFAHYFTTVIFDGQLLVHAASDPFGYGWNLFGTADWRVVAWLSPTVVWYVGLIAIVAGHVAAAVLVHDRALQVFGRRVAFRVQYGMLVLMVSSTSFALYVLAG
jgi:hypothetical protein